jgi:hypothetical protein
VPAHVGEERLLLVRGDKSGRGEREETGNHM